MNSEQPYRDRIADVIRHEIGEDERLLAASRFSMPNYWTMVDEKGNEQNLMQGLISRVALVVRPAPRSVPGFPLHWSMAVALTPHRVVFWRVRRGSNHPSALLGAVRLPDLREAKLQTVPIPGGRALAVKFVPLHGPVVMVDVVAGFRQDSEHFVDLLRMQLGLPPAPLST
ncbi:MAG: hypothetical protein ACKV2O_04905 [Acidimicrobiales bacterium]